MFPSTRSILSSLALAALAALAATAMAQEAAGPIARTSLSPTGARFEPLIAADSWTLTVTGPRDFHVESKALQPPFVSSLIISRNSENCGMARA